MQKIMFNDNYGLTKAVLEKRKTQTRRIINLSEDDEEYLDNDFNLDYRKFEIVDRYSRYKVGDVIAVAQCYGESDFCNIQIPILHKCKINTKEHGAIIGIYMSKAGWDNKMFVRADMMPHRIRINNIRVEKLQDISDKDCIAEGIDEELMDKISDFDKDEYQYYFYNKKDDDYLYYSTPKEAYASLIDKISGKGTWKRNPYVFVYEFELIY